MKKTKILLAAMVLFISGCSLFSFVSLSPPDWIIGTWSTNTGAVSADMKYIFTDDNCVMSGFSMSIDFIEAYKKASLRDASSDTLYTISVSATGTDAKYTFKKVNSTSFNYSNTVNGLTVGPITLYKQ